MSALDRIDLLFVACAFVFQTALLIHFSLRKWRFETALRYGAIVYALGIPAAAASLLLLAQGRGWAFWLSGFLYLAWGVYGYVVEYVRHIEWRSPMVVSVFVPYLLLYLAVTMFYWFPLALLWKPLWYAYGALFVINTYLNVTSHKKSGGSQA